MRILVFTQYFTPEITATAVRLHPFMVGLAERGHDVEVICEVPNHPRGIVEPEYRGKLVQRRGLDGFDASYVWVRAGPSKSALNRMASYGSYALMASAVGSVRARPDVVFASSPPLSVGAAAALVAARHRVPWVLDVRDIWPDVAVTLGELSNRRVIALTSRLERRLYRSATRIVTVTEPFLADIAARVADPSKVELIPNGTTRAWLDLGAQAVDRGGAGLPEGRFVWAYGGNLGLSHGLEVAIEAARRLGEGFHLLVIGDGPRRRILEEEAADLVPGTVAFRPTMDPRELAGVLRACDALLVIQRADIPKVVSSKLFDCCALGRPVISAAEGEMQRLVTEAGAALTVPAGDPGALAAAVERLRDDPALGVRLASHGRDFAAAYLREDHAVRLARLLESAAGS
ncbi:MAG: glycosyltransferase family 4 protein [Actinomycetota bacterium]